MNGAAPSSVAAWTQAIVAVHGARFAGFAPQPVPDADLPSPAAHAALAACSALGFIAADALCLAHAWSAQTERLGAFDPAQWPHEAHDFGVHGRASGPAFASCPQQLGLYAVLPDAAWVARMARAGVPTLQLRFKSSDAQAIAREVHAAVAAVQGTSAQLFINDHWREALAAGAYGVHLGQEDLDALAPAALVELRERGLRLGVSTHGYAELLRADAARPSYIAMGAVFPTTLKKMATAPQGVARLQEYARLMQGYPQVAIGGIALEQFAQVRATGVGSIAVVRALVNAADPEAAAAALLQAMA